MSLPVTATKSEKKLNKDGTPRKAPERIPRTPEEVAFASCNSVLKRLPSNEIRARVMRSLTALWGAS